MNCEKIAFENLSKDIQIELLRSTIQTPKNRGRSNSEDQTNGKILVNSPKVKVHSRDGSTKSSDPDSSTKNESESNKVLNRKGSNNEIDKNKQQQINKEETRAKITTGNKIAENDQEAVENETDLEVNETDIKKEVIEGIDKDGEKDFEKDEEVTIKEKMEKIEMIKEELNEILREMPIGVDQGGMKEVDKEVVGIEEEKKINEDERGLEINERKREELKDEEQRRSVGVMTESDEKVGKSSGAEELLRNLISRLPLPKEKGKIGNFDKKFKSIDDLRRLQGKAGQMTEQNVRDILIEVKKFYAITIADMQKNFKTEFDKLSVGHEVALSKMRMQHQEKILVLKREHKERVDKILAAHEEEIKKINTQQQLAQSGNRSSKGLRKK
ncbi:tRNA(Thr) (cytosine(32)-N(3))-methyltransferase isoform X1 [Nilaparvata lugens]|uniref:tRNA(Thr) (cytosine(32)-N(3))-methyltransferase isoform X1 n=1 Tax=Nilaparvata lugens TaxID=108931 RepID=UPI00193E9CE1|nr:tRNA(Thr) (cytosine(32)-N(3))-methyltransferase isoform X1 [Nilaparvata lugens]